MNWIEMNVVVTRLDRCAGEKNGSDPSRIGVRRRGRGGFTLIEMAVVMSMLAVLLLIIASTLWGAVRVERADSALLNRISTQIQLADRFREDVATATKRLDNLIDMQASEHCVILRRAENWTVIYRWADDRLVRREIRDGSDLSQSVPIGGEDVRVRFVVHGTERQTVTMELMESRGAGRSRHDWPIHFTATLGAYRQ